jgi:hypothetical protein
MPPHPTPSLRRALSARRGMFDSRDQIAADDDRMPRMLTHRDGNGAGRVRYLPRVLVRMRLGGVSNRSPGHLLRKSWADDQALRPCKHHRGSSIRRRAAAPGSAGVLPTTVRSAVCVTVTQRILSASGRGRRLRLVIPARKPEFRSVESESLIGEGEAREFHQGTGIDHDPATGAG